MEPCVSTKILKSASALHYADTKIMHLRPSHILEFTALWMKYISEQSRSTQKEFIWCKRTWAIRNVHSTEGPDAEILRPLPRIFVSKNEPGAGPYMPEDPFGPKKPSMSPYWDFAITRQTSRWLKNRWFFQKKMVLAFWAIPDSRIYLFWLSWTHMKGITYA